MCQDEDEPYQARVTECVDIKDASLPRNDEPPSGSISTATSWTLTLFSLCCGYVMTSIW